MAAGRGVLQLEEPSLRRAGPAGGEGAGVPAPGREAHRGAGREAHRRAGPRRQVVGGAGRAVGDDRTGEVAGRGRGRRRARRRGRSPQGGRRPPAARRATRRGAGREAAGQGAGPRRRVVGVAGQAAGDDRTGEVTGRGRGRRRDSRVAQPPRRGGSGSVGLGEPER
ncbi:hypothetical protein PVAP13_7KG163155 [Panicum virgatum]|uniref:Uncharacterized protein n=1 Tax=Panicum virgatum TaxID=38727 RepID=A0A8T0QGE5_PANVG|nr:hypothetical protein PVAP13_7KG163155 [Panicum virgatum]